MTQALKEYLMEKFKDLLISIPLQLNERAWDFSSALMWGQSIVKPRKNKVTVIKFQQLNTAEM